MTGGSIPSVVVAALGNCPVFQSVVCGGIEWAAGKAGADVAPNLARVAPLANVLPKFGPPPAPPTPPTPPAK